MFIVVEVSYHYSIEQLLKNKVKASVTIRNIVSVLKYSSSFKVQYF